GTDSPIGSHRTRTRRLIPRIRVRSFSAPDTNPWYKTAGSDLTEPEPAVLYHGFVSGAEKERLFRECDALCFPTYYEAESFGLVLLEAMAFGLPVIATRWRMIPEVLPKDYPLIEPRSPEQIVLAIKRLLTSEEGLRLRD